MIILTLHHNMSSLWIHSGDHYGYLDHPSPQLFSFFSGALCLRDGSPKFCRQDDQTAPQWRRGRGVEGLGCLPGVAPLHVPRGTCQVGLGDLYTRSGTPRTRTLNSSWAHAIFSLLTHVGQTSLELPHASNMVKHDQPFVF